MKKIFLKLMIIPLLLIVAVGFASCGDKAPNKSIIKEVIYSLCDIQKNTVSSLQENYIKFTAVDNKTLQIEHGLTINCCCDSITIKSSQEQEDIVINVSDYGSECNCPCLGTVTYDVSDLQINTIYTFTFKRWEDTFYTTEITFNTELNKIVKL
jgi:hypothetical protein